MATRGGTKIVRCPKCSRIQEWVVNQDGQLQTRQQPPVIMIGYVCEDCKAVIHWGMRGPAQKKA